MEEADQLLPAARRLSAWSAPTPTAAETDRLVQALLAELPAQRPARSWSMVGWLLLAQVRVVQQEIWLASAFVITLGVLVTLAGQPEASLEALPFVLVAPLVAALGIAFLYGPTAEPALEIELAAPLSARLIVLTRLLLVFAFDFVLSLLGSALLTVTSGSWSMWPLVTAWFAPMTFLTALAFLLAMTFGEPLIGAAVCLFLWGMQVLRLLPPFATLPNLMAADAQGWLWLIALMCAAMAVWLAGREERWLIKPG